MIFTELWLKNHPLQEACWDPHPSLLLWSLFSVSVGTYLAIRVGIFLHIVLGKLRIKKLSASFCLIDCQSNFGWLPKFNQYHPKTELPFLVRVDLSVANFLTKASVWKPHLGVILRSYCWDLFTDLCFKCAKQRYYENDPYKTQCSITVWKLLGKICHMPLLATGEIVLIIVGQEQMQSFYITSKI